ncbi:alpha/beta hydrolase [Nosocomiicoccus ampullae]|uniref:alpha/beta hydrolase n=1 Tax=Nosocomiicoccus ampullae TaxID=489910 RepID=UPI001C5E5AF0|nr:alpha/beta hydrolase-fold protein [Nosocomiicoccus ampullae]QYA48864.1 esterase family protein [Nosocomiicoccus ampullae]
MNFSTGIHNSEINSTILNETIDFQYYIPKQFNINEKYHVYYMFDSQDFFKYGQIDRIYERLYKNNEIETAIMVGIPYPNVEWRNHHFQPEGEHTETFMEFITKEFVPFVDDNFPTIDSRDSRLLMGESLAGSFSIKLGIHYPNLFKNILSFSPEITDEFYDEIVETDGTKDIHLYHTIGLEEQDFITITGRQANFLDPNRELNEVLFTIPERYEYKELDGGHIWKTWKPEIEHALKFFYGV